MKNKEISELISHGRAYNSSSFLLRVGQNKENNPKNIAFLAPKKIFKTAVLRNKVKRRLKNALNINKNTYLSSNKSICMVFLAKKGVLDISFKEVSLEMKNILPKVL